MFKITLPSPTPHYQGDESTSLIMKGVLYALMPALLMSVIFFGIDSLKVIFTAMISCILFEFIFQKYVLKSISNLQDGSAAVTGLLLAFCLPVTAPIWLILLGSLFSIGVAKIAFGGIGKNLFNPALAGRCFLLLLFPVQMTTWKGTVLTADTFTGATPLGLVSESVKSGKSLLLLTGNSQMPRYFDLFWGNVAGSLGEISALALLIGGGYLLWKKIITWHIPATIFTAFFVLEGVLWIIAPSRFADPVFHLMTGGMMLGALFMATDPTTSPVTPSGQIVFGFGIALLTLLIRNFGPYPEGIAIAILVMNGFTPLINKRMKPIQMGRLHFQ
jgi:Na+-translocating ferredoxin:NAD+ oxidoreductase subunit D